MDHNYFLVADESCPFQVADPNEITLHLLDVLHVHVRRTQPYPTECHHAKDSNGANGLLADTNASRQRGRPGRIPPTGEYLSRVQRMILEVVVETMNCRVSCRTNNEFIHPSS